MLLLYVYAVVLCFVDCDSVVMCHKVYIFFCCSFLCGSVLSVRDYLHEKAAESRHNEVSAYLMFIAGSVLFVGGVLETLFVAEELGWVLFVPVEFSGAPGCVLGLVLTFSGLALGVFGLVAGIYFARDRAWYMRELRNASFVEEDAVARKKKKRRVSKSVK